VLQAKTDKGIALQDMLRDVHTLVTHIKFSDKILVTVYSKMAEIEQRYSLLLLLLLLLWLLLLLLLLLLMLLIFFLLLLLLLLLIVVVYLASHL
jgi:hypothetical protein